MIAGSVALAHDYLLVQRGAERTFASIADLAPGAPVYTLLYDAEGTDDRFAHHPVVTSPLQRLGARQSDFRSLLPLMPWAASRLDATGHELVLSSSSAFAHGLRVGDATHVCYCHTPFRYAWFEQERALGEVNRILRPALDLTLRAIRHRDRRLAQSVTHFVANSRICRERISRFWGRDAAVVYPPVAVEQFSPGEPGDYLMVVGEIVRHKRTPQALEAAKRANRRMVVVGDGPDLPRLRAVYGEVHEFRGRVSDAELSDLYSHALALVVPNVEEFGIAAVEAQAAGRPVIAADAGGARETVVAGETGRLVREGDLDALTEALADTDFAAFDPARIRRNAERFSTKAFQGGFEAEVAYARSIRSG